MWNKTESYLSAYNIVSLHLISNNYSQFTQYYRIFKYLFREKINSSKCLVKNMLMKSGYVQIFGKYMFPPPPKKKIIE